MKLIRRGTRAVGYAMLPIMACGAVLFSAQPAPSRASSHREAPLIAKDPSVDNTDVYAFVSPDDQTTVTLISNWIPFEEPAGGPNFYHFDDNARYYIRVDRDGDALPDVSYQWTFRTEIRNPNTFLYNTGPIDSRTDTDLNYTQRYTVTELLGNATTGTVIVGNQLMVPDNVGPRSNPDYETVAAQFVNTGAGGIKEFTGQRNDPFFVDIGTIFDLGGLRPFNQAHILKLPTAPGIDSLAGYNIHTTALQIPRLRLAPTCPVGAAIASPTCVIGVWSTAERPSVTTRSLGREVGSGAYVQVSRLGNPLVNEVVMSLALKDTFNGVPPSVDRTVPAVVERVTNPELPQLILALYAGTITSVPPAPRNDLVTVFLTGVQGVTQQQNSAATPSEQLRLNVAIPPSSNGVCGGNRMGIMAGDLAGFPNGRRLEDDVTDIAIRAAAGGYGPILGGPPFNFPNISPNNMLGDGVNVDDAACLSAFPYMGTPSDGYTRIHAALSQRFLPLIQVASGAFSR